MVNWDRLCDIACFPNDAYGEFAADLACSDFIVVLPMGLCKLVEKYQRGVFERHFAEL
jgi:hypothetical protein